MSYFEQGVPQDSSFFQVGIAAHACMQAVVQAQRDTTLSPEEVEEETRKAVYSLVHDGRWFEGRPEPPMTSETAWAGAEIIRSYLRKESLPVGCKAEVGLAVDRQWQPVAYSDRRAWLKCVIDIVGGSRQSGEEWLMGDGEFTSSLLLADGKTSMLAQEQERFSLQRKIQGLVGWANLGGSYQSMTLRVLNLRLCRPYDLEITPGDPEDAAMLARWRLDIEGEIRMREAQKRPDGSRPATPGAGCYGCPFLGRCEPAQEALKRGKLTDTHEAAQRLAVIEAERSRLSGVLRKASAMAPINVSGGFVGYRETIELKPKPAIAGVVWTDWIGRRACSTVDEAIAMARALIQASKLTASNLKALASVRWLDRKDEDKRTAWVRSLCMEEGGSEFGVWRTTEDGEETINDGPETTEI